MKVIWFSLAMLLVISFVSCSQHNNKTDNKSQEINQSDIDKSMIKVNRYLSRTENEEINNYIKRHGLDMIETGSGLRFQIFKKGSGDKLEKGSLVKLKYKCMLISGDVVYSSDKDGLKNFEIGHGGVESGLEEALLHMNKGDVAKIIIPSHLAYGLLGDQKRIPSHATLIYEIEVLK